MTEKLYYNDSLATKFNATVINCEKSNKDNLYELILDKTLFYPEGGGQPSDIGKINSSDVVYVKEKDDEIVHYVTEKFEKGENIEGKIDQDRRLDFMQQHTGEHILSGLIHSKFGYDNVGFRIGKEFVELDFNGSLTKYDVESLEQKANEMIYADKPIIVTYPTKEELSQLNYRSKKELAGQIRIVNVQNCDICACCGTHFKSTAPVGMIKIVNFQKYKDGVRIFMLAGKRALQDYKIKNDIVLYLSAATSSKPYETDKAMDKIMEENSKLKASLNSLNEKLIKYKAMDIAEGSKDAVIFEDNMNSAELRKFCEVLCERANIAMVCCGNDEIGYKYALGSLKENVAEIGKAINKKLNGKGGGKGNIIQGSLSCTRCEIEKFIHSL